MTVEPENLLTQFLIKIFISALLIAGVASAWVEFLAQPGAVLRGDCGELRRDGAGFAGVAWELREGCGNA